MDAADVKLLRAMGLVPFVNSPRRLSDLSGTALAKAAGLTPRAARERLRALERAGALVGYEAYPNLRLFHLESKSYHYRPPVQSKDAIIAGVRDVEGVVGVQDFVGVDLCLDLCYRDKAERDRRLRAVGRVVPGGAPVEWFDYRMPAVRERPTRTDWRIVRELRHRANRPAADVARSLKLTARTVQRRVDRLLREGLLDVIPMVDLSALAGVTPYALLFRLDPAAGPGVRAAILANLTPTYLWSWTPPTAELANFALVLIAQRTGEIQETRNRCASLRGVAQVDALVLGKGQEWGEWIDEAIDREIAAVSEVDASTA